MIFPVGFQVSTVGHYLVFTCGRGPSVEFVALGSYPAALSSQKREQAMNVCPFLNELGKVCSQQFKPLVNNSLLGRARTK